MIIKELKNDTNTIIMIMNAFSPVVVLVLIKGAITIIIFFAMRFKKTISSEIINDIIY